MNPEEEKLKPIDMVENDPIIRSQGVEKIYDTGEIRVHALRGLDLEISRGEIVAVMGPSGCGKTTLLNCLSGIDEIDDGKILIEDKDISKMSDRERTEYRAKNMGFIFQSYNLIPVLSALENVQLPLLVSGVNVKAAKGKAMNALEVVGLKEWAKHKPSELSGGQQQRVAIARSLVNDPVIVWADEPTGNLDKENTVQIMKLLSTLNKEKNQTYVVVTHDPLVSGMADRIVRMENGRIVE